MKPVCSPSIEKGQGSVGCTNVGLLDGDSVKGMVGLCVGVFVDASVGAAVRADCSDERKPNTSTSHKWRKLFWFRLIDTYLRSNITTTL